MTDKHQRHSARVTGGALAAIVALAACETEGALPSPPNGSVETSASEAAARGMLLARPGLPSVALPAGAGRVPLGLDGRRDGFLYIPRAASPSAPLPLVVFFHGAGGDARQADAILAVAERDRALVLSIDSRGSTWDLVADSPGPDVAFLDRALAWTFDRVRVDPARITAAGFSDGASYALSIGLANGDLFRSVVAFSPGFVAPPLVRGKPPVFVSHGTADTVLRIDRCGRRIARDLARSGYTVTYREFAGAHAVPPAIAVEAFGWLFGARPGASAV